MQDPREAPAAAAYADVVAAREQLIPVGLPVVLALLAAALVAVALGGLRPLWLLPLAVAVVVRPIQRRIRTRALSSAAANRALAYETGIHLPDRPAPREAWQGATSWGVAGLIVVLLAVHLGAGSVFGSEAPPPPAAPVEADDMPSENIAWYAHAEAECKRAATALGRLAGDGASMRAKRHAARLKAFDAIAEGAGLSPDRANGAMVHLYAAIRHERDAIALERSGADAASAWSAAAREAEIATSLLDALGVPGCDAAFA